MSVLARIEEAQALTEMQRKFVEQVLRGKEPDEAKALAGYADTVNEWAIMGSEAVQKAIQAACDAALGGAVRVRALKAMKAMLEDDTPAATRFQAAKFVLERGKDAKRTGDKPLSEMTEAELLGVIERSQAAMNEAKDARIIDVTPNNGAQPD